jgi:hypothetical protein
MMPMAAAGTNTLTKTPLAVITLKAGNDTALILIPAQNFKTPPKNLQLHITSTCLHHKRYPEEAKRQKRPCIGQTVFAAVYIDSKHCEGTAFLTTLCMTAWRSNILISYPANTKTWWADFFWEGRRTLHCINPASKQV